MMMMMILTTMMMIMMMRRMMITGKTREGGRYGGEEIDGYIRRRLPIVVFLWLVQAGPDSKRGEEE